MDRGGEREQVDDLVPQKAQQLYGGVRTDLDRFDADLSVLLAGWGEQAARKALSDHSGIFANYPEGSSAVAPDATQSAVLGAAGKRDLRTVMSAQGDAGWAWALRGTVLSLLFLCVVVPIGLAVATVTTLVQNASAAERKAAAVEADVKRDGLIESYNNVYGEIANAVVDNDLSRIRRILARERAGLFAKKVAVQERVAVLDEASDTPSTTAVTSPVAAERVTFPQRVFIQFAGTYTRAQMTALNASLRAAGWDMQSTSGERTTKAIGVNQVRYGDGGAAAADALVKALAASTDTPIRGVEPKSMRFVGNRNLEIWISN
ncbi:hypothetical protein MC45_01325 [Sphingomonas taxi]|uniref:Uncharacterized protein n=1 Tax=Sphingomonas taxi TaxID=1549858 RepID=A0A097ECI0_9SPHN|nr:hypothetical protein [Sphingomonas taxi]AIT05279.1 hypothetical protein MC45_01325 [Sphingomonas taxi]